jgi:hypothetical protein
MTITAQTLERIQLDIETAHGQLVTGMVDPAVSEDAKMLAAAIALAGSEIALAIAGETTTTT